MNENKHAEIEDGAVGTVFTNKTTEARATVEHKLGLWHGMAGYHYTESDYDADGEEAFTPASLTKTNAIFMLEERQFGDVTVELGARLEDYQIDSAVSMAEHHHDHDHHRPTLILIARLSSPVVLVTSRQAGATPARCPFTVTSKSDGKISSISIF